VGLGESGLVVPDYCKSVKNEGKENLLRCAANQCSVVAGYWNKLTGSNVFVTSPTSCCIGSLNPSIPGVWCDKFTNVYLIFWDTKKLIKPFVEVFGEYLPQDLRKLQAL
jgi:hypothetical protein